MNLTITQMQMLKKQVDESFTHLRKAVSRRQEILHQQIELAIHEEFTQLSEEKEQEHRELMADATTLHARIKAFEEWMEENGYRLVVGRQSWGTTDIGSAEVKRGKWLREGSSNEINRRKLEVDEGVEAAIFDIEERRLKLNRSVIEDNVESAEDVLALIPKVEELLPTPKYLEGRVAESA